MTQAPKQNVGATRAPRATPQGKRPATAKIDPAWAFGAAVQKREVLGVGGMLALQAAAGNRVVAGLVQPRRERSSRDESARVHEAAKLGVGGASGELPYLERIQRSFGRHDVTGVVAHTGAQATAGAHAMGAAAFTMGNHVAFAGSPDLRTAAHEAAHVVQQRGGVQLSGGVGVEGDRYEQHADAVAGLVVQGRSAERLLDLRGIPGSGSSPTREGLQMPFQARPWAPMAVQRLVGPDKKAGDKVKIKRTTSRALHGEVATIVRLADTSYEYVVRVSDQEFIASFDQLVPVEEKLGDVTVESQIQELIQTQTPKEILDIVREKVAATMGLSAKDVTVSGSFAILLHAIAAGREARTPRDIDVFVPKTASAALAKLSGLTLFGVPVEGHPEGHLGKRDPAGIVSLNNLLAKDLIKLLDQTSVFREVVPLPEHVAAKEIPASALVSEMESKTPTVLQKLQTTDRVSNFKRDGEIWIKTLKDVKTLVASGATLEQFQEEEDPWS